MKEITVFGTATVTVSTIIRVSDDANLSEEEIYARAEQEFRGIIPYAEMVGTIN